MFLDYLYKKSKKIFKNRKISSIYFDNKNFDMYNHSIEGLVQEKIRLRYYNEDKKEFQYEIKINSAEGRYKISKKTINNTVLNGFLIPIMVNSNLLQLYLIRDLIIY